MFSGFFIIRIESKTAYIYISLAWNMFARDLTYCCSMVIIIDIEKLENLWWKSPLHLNMLRTDCSHQNFDHFQLIFFSSFTQCFIAFASFNFSSCFFFFRHSHHSCILRLIESIGLTQSEMCAASAHKQQIYWKFHIFSWKYLTIHATLTMHRKPKFC